MTDTPILSVAQGVFHCKALMSIKGLMVSLASNIIAGGVLWYFKGPNAGLWMIGIGFALLLAAFAFFRKPDSPPRAGVDTSIQVNPQINPQFNLNPTIQIGISSSAENERQERRKHEELVLAFMRKEKKSLVETVASGTGLTMKQAADALESLYFQRCLFRSQIEAPGNFIYWLSDL